MAILSRQWHEWGHALYSWIPMKDTLGAKYSRKLLQSGVDNNPSRRTIDCYWAMWWDYLQVTLDIHTFYALSLCSFCIPLQDSLTKLPFLFLGVCTGTFRWDVRKNEKKMFTTVLLEHSLTRTYYVLLSEPHLTVLVNYKCASNDNKLYSQFRFHLTCSVTKLQKMTRLLCIQTILECFSGINDIVINRF